MVARLGQAINLINIVHIIKITLSEKIFEFYNICPYKTIMHINSDINLQAADRQCLILVNTLYNKGGLFLNTFSCETFHYVMKPVCLHNFQWHAVLDSVGIAVGSLHAGFPDVDFW